MTCLIKISTDNWHDFYKKPAVVNLGELDLSLGLEIWSYVQSKAGKVEFVDLQKTLELKVNLITNVEAIKEVKLFFEMDQYYLSSEFNLINYLAWVVITNRQHKIYQEIWSLSNTFHFGYKYRATANRLYNTLENDRSDYKNCLPVTNTLENLHAILSLLLYKKQHSEFMIGIVGEYLDSKSFRNDLIDLHPSLYKYTSH
jgi:hypothetical protein